MKKLLAACKASYSQEEYERLKRAVEFAKNAHAGQLRESGEPYHIHPEAVALSVFDMGMDENSVIAGLLHDTLEDCGVSYSTIKEMFGEEVASMVDGVTKLTKSGNVNITSREDRQAENLRKMFIAIAKDVRVVIIKLADRLHNMQTLEYCDPEKRYRKAKETMEVYAPLAHRFGMGVMKCELEDLSFEYLHPDECRRLKEEIEPQQEERMNLLANAMQTITKQLAEAGIEAEIGGRRKHLYSIYKKMVKQNVTIDKIYDMVALRVIVHTVNDCYAALGVIHSMWPPMPGRFKDYIAMPKTNNYRSLHTTLFGDNKMPFEVQIRTLEMHKAAEYGIAAHWMYKEGRQRQDELDSKLAWLREALEYESLADTTREFVENIRKDFFSDFVFVLTPTGEIIDLPAGSTPVDFAYRIHTDVGNHTQHAKVNGSMVKLDYKLKNHDVVDIITSQQAAPRRDWLNFVKTQQAKAKVKNWFKKANRDENIMRGREMLADAAKRQGHQLADITKSDYVEEMVKRYNFSNMDDVYAALGYGGLTTKQVLHPLIEQFRKEKKERELAERFSKGEEQKSNDCTGIRVLGEENMAVRFAGCCSPVPNDAIIGYITRGRGVSIHHAECKNVKHLLEDAERIVTVEWMAEQTQKYPVNVILVSHERVGLLMDITQTLMSMNVNLMGISAKKDDSEVVNIQLSFEVKNSEYLNSIMRGLGKIEGVERVSRVV